MDILFLVVLLHTIDHCAVTFLDSDGDFWVLNSTILVTHLTKTVMCLEWCNFKMSATCDVMYHVANS